MPAEIEQELASAFELVARPSDADGVVVTPAVRIDAAYLDAAGPQLRIVANYAVGIDNIDLDAARARGVVVSNTPGVLTERDRRARHRARPRAAASDLRGRSRRCDGATSGSGGRTSWSARASRGRISSSSARDGSAGASRSSPRRTVRARVSPDATTTSLPLLPSADVISLHCPLTPDTRHLVDASALAAMKPTAVLVNTARGAVVDEAALVDALRAGAIAGAALDVFEHEPAVSEELLAMENVVVTPHIASATRDARHAMGMLCVSALRAVLLEGRTPPNAV